MSRRRKPLPALAAAFIHSLEPTHKKSSLNGYRNALRKFHRWLDKNALSVEQLERRHTSQWLQFLSAARLGAKTINHHIIFTRLYLRWLYEQGELKCFPDDLIRVSDMVKEPKYLPRPLPPLADKTLQERLARAGDIYSLGLLLMRKTGIRNGELRSLEKNCVRCDHLGNRFLKVPLGKLNTERLVPIDEDTNALIDRLKGTDDEKTFLIETKTGKKTRYNPYVEALKKAAEGLETNGRLGTHRLRHTFATTLLNAGMSIVGLMKLLGHTDHRMTLRYAEILLETVNKEYFDAIRRIESRYDEILNNCPLSESENNPLKMLEDVVHLLANMSANDATIKTLVRNISKRIQRIQQDIEKLFSNLKTRH